MIFSKKVLITIVCLCFVLTIRFLYAYQTRHIYHDKEQASWNTLLLSDIDSGSQNAELTTTLPNSFPPDRVTIRFLGDSTIRYGQHITVSGTLSRKVLKDNSVVNTINFAHVKANHSISDYLLYPLYYIRQRILALFQMTLSDIDSSLLLGIVFGIKANMPKVFSQQLQSVGVTHVIAASGMNVTMVAGFLIWFLGKYLPRRVAIALSISGLIVYAVFSGLQSSILRATIMGSSAFLAQLFGRQYHGMYLLFVTGSLMLFISPQALFDVGFQLSFLSTLGIITMQPLLRQKNILTEDLSTTIAAQIATLPILLTSFGQYNLLSILVNGLVLWTIPPLMIIGSLAAVSGVVVPVVGRCVLLSAVPLLWFFEAVVSFFAAIPAVLRFSTTSPFVIIGYYLLIVAISSFVYRRKKIQQGDLS